jgi:hypothetical protein
MLFCTRLSRLSQIYDSKLLWQEAIKKASGLNQHLPNDFWLGWEVNYIHILQLISWLIFSFMFLIINQSFFALYCCKRKSILMNYFLAYSYFIIHLRGMVEIKFHSKFSFPIGCKSIKLKFWRRKCIFRGVFRLRIALKF